MKTNFAILAALLLLGIGNPTQASASGGQRVEIDKTHQILRAYEGNRLVFSTNISTGRHNSTPSGTFRAGGKERMHYSRLFHNAPMPYSVSLGGNYFIHGFSSVPDYPASHGCVRLPVGAAKQLYNWIEPGTPVHISGSWSSSRSSSTHRKHR